MGGEVVRGCVRVVVDVVLENAVCGGNGEHLAVNGPVGIVWGRFAVAGGRDAVVVVVGDGGGVRAAANRAAGRARERDAERFVGLGNIIGDGQDVEGVVVHAGGEVDRAGVVAAG